METQAQDVQPTETQAPADDVFGVDESKFISLSPEQRAALDPVISEWKSKAKNEIERVSRSSEEKYAPVREKAEALERLTQDPRFVQWWSNVQQESQRQTGQGIKMQEIATNEEWQAAISNAYAGDGRQLQSLQQRMF